VDTSRYLDYLRKTILARTGIELQPAEVES